MKKIVIVGSGQLGSRHLQGVLKYKKEKLVVYVMDPSQDALQVSMERAEEIEHNHELHFISNVDHYLNEAEIAIVATNSNVREMVTINLLKRTNLKHLILEKVLFQELEAYDRFSQAVSNYDVKIYVNHPRRLTPTYLKIANEIKQIKGRSYFSIVGEFWDLGCNSLHMIDLFVFLSDSKLRSLNTDGLDDTIFHSKRKGYVEFTGTITGIMENNDSFALSSFPGERGPLTLQISTKGNRWLIQEGGTKAFLHLEAENKYAVAQHDFFQEFQSNLTTQIITDLLDYKECGLPSYEEAAHTHKIFIESLLNKYNTITNLNETKCPIT
jgi:predicted dehydrogenase